MQNEVEIRNVLTRIEARIAYVNEQLLDAPEGRLAMQQWRGKQTLIRERENNGKRTRNSLEHQPELAAALLQRDMLRLELDALEKDRQAVTTLLKRYRPVDYQDIVFQTQKRFPQIEGRFLRELIEGAKTSGWADEPYEKSDYHAEELRHTTSRGLLVRSKSELVIAEKLAEYGVEFRYEQVLYVGNTRMLPDFTIRRADGKLFYWEHAGMTNRNTYLSQFQYKQQLYAGMGIVPWDNLIITYDNEKGDADVRIIESWIRYKLLL